MGLDYLEYLMELEKVFEIKIPDEEAALFTTVGDVELYLATDRPDLSPETVRGMHRGIITKVLILEPDKIANLKPSDRLIEDLRFD